jgi:hypothetical protein
MEKDNRQELGRLITEQLLQKGTGANEFAREHFPGNKSRSFYNWKLGLTAPTSTGSRKQLEDSLGWKPGAVTEVLNAPITQQFDLADLQDWSKREDPSVARASELTTLELLTELTRRTLDMEERLQGQSGGGNVVPLHKRPLNLAANSTDAGRNTEHLEDNDD